MNRAEETSQIRPVRGWFRPKGDFHATEHPDMENARNPRISATAVKTNSLTVGTASRMVEEIVFDETPMRELKKPVIVDSLDDESYARTSDILSEAAKLEKTAYFFTLVAPWQPKGGVVDQVGQDPQRLFSFSSPAWVC